MRRPGWHWRHALGLLTMRDNWYRLSCFPRLRQVAVKSCWRQSCGVWVKLGNRLWQCFALILEGLHAFWRWNSAHIVQIILAWFALLDKFLSRLNIFKSLIHLIRLWFQTKHATKFIGEHSRWDFLKSAWCLVSFKLRGIKIIKIAQLVKQVFSLVKAFLQGTKASVAFKFRFICITQTRAHPIRTLIGWSFCLLQRLVCLGI